MATNYIKVHPYVAEKLGLTGQRSTYPDGCVQLYEKDLSLIDRGWVFGRREATIARIGGILFDPYANRAQHSLDPADSTPLPTPTDPAYLPPEPEPEEPATEPEEPESEPEPEPQPEPEEPAPYPESEDPAE